MPAAAGTVYRLGWMDRAGTKACPYRIVGGNSAGLVREVCESSPFFGLRPSGYFPPSFCDPQGPEDGGDGEGGVEGGSMGAQVARGVEILAL